MKLLDRSGGSLVLAAILFAVGGVSVASGAKIDGVTDTNPYKGANGLTGNIVNITENGSGLNFNNRNVYAGYSDTNNEIVSNNVVSIAAGVTINSTGMKGIAGGYTHNNAIEGNLVEKNKIEITGATIKGDNSNSYIVGGRANRNTNGVKENTVTITNNSDIGYDIYGGKASNETSNFSKVTNNHISINNSKFGRIWGGQAQNQSSSQDNKNDATHNTVDIVGGGVSANIIPTKLDLRGGTTYGLGDSLYNTLSISGGTNINMGTNKVHIVGGYSQGFSGGENKFNQLIIDNVTITAITASDSGKFWGGMGDTSAPNAIRSKDVTANRAYIKDLTFANGTVVGGGVGNHTSNNTLISTGNAISNIAVVTGNTSIKEIRGGEALGSGNANKNFVVLDLATSGNVSGDIYGGFSANGSKTQNNAVYFKNGTVVGKVVGGNKEKTDNTLILGNGTETNFGSRKAGQIENFVNLNFNVIKEGNSRDNAVLELTGASSSLNGVNVKFLSKDGKISAIRGKGAAEALSGATYTKYSAKDTKTIKVVESITEHTTTETTNGFTYHTGTDYTFTLGDNINLEEKGKKYYLIKGANKLTDWKSMGNYNTSIGGAGTEVTHWDDTKGLVVDAYQTNQEYTIDNASTYTRNIRGMFVSSDEKDLYITSNADIKETIGTTIGGDDFFTKFGQGKSDNTISIVPKKGEGLDLSGVTFDGGSGTNTLNVGKDKNPVEMDKIKVKDIKNFDEINFYLPKNPSPGQTAITLTGGAGTDLSRSAVKVIVDDLRDLEKSGGRVHLLKTANGNPIAKNAKSAEIQIGTSVVVDMPSDSLDLFAKTPDPKPTPVVVNDQTKIFNESRIAGMAALWEGSYLISNHLERIIPDGYTTLFPYAIVEGYDKRYNTGSHVDTIGFNANAGLAGKAPNSKGEFTMGIFVEYGTVDYDAYLDDGTHGDGDAYYAGVGAFGKQDNLGGSYFEGTFRVGKLTTEFGGTLNFNGVSKYYDFGIDSTYYAAHVGLGKIFALSDTNDLDAYVRYFYTHIDAADVEIDGMNTHFDALQSHKIRAGLKDDFKIDEHNKFYVGVAGEYEFDSRAGGRFLVGNAGTGEILTPDLRGLTGIGEIGYQYKTDTIKFDAGVKGYVGKQEGVSAQMAISIAF